MGELTSLVNSLKPKIIAITETWCKDSIGDAKICLLNYVLYRYDRCNTISGGVMLYIHESLQSVSCTPLNDVNTNEARRRQNRGAVGANAPTQKIVWGHCPHTLPSTSYKSFT